MLLKANVGMYLTQADNEIPFSERKFERQVYVSTSREVDNWVEISEDKKNALMARETILDVENLSPEYLDKVAQLQEQIPQKINEKNFSDENALKYKKWYPTWGEGAASYGTTVKTGFKFQYSGVLYEVVQEHQLSSSWVPGVGTESLYLVVQESHSGTEEDPIVWQKNMTLERDKYYKDGDVLYKCIRSSEGLGMMFALADLVAAGYVEDVVE